MKRFNLILKGVLFWITAFSLILFILFLDCGNLNLFMGFWFAMNVGLLYICWNRLSVEDVYLLSGSKLMDKILNTSR